uniref:Uncharacterized protein n=1 Tax=Cucumis sativus TaxID=3659 RepID=A0A0A0KP91_CUCSA
MKDEPKCSSGFMGCTHLIDKDILAWSHGRLIDKDIFANSYQSGSCSLVVRLATRDEQIA